MVVQIRFEDPLFALVAAAWSTHGARPPGCGWMRRCLHSGLSLEKDRLTKEHLTVEVKHRKHSYALKLTIGKHKGI